MLKIIAADNLVPLAEHLCATQLNEAGWESQWQSPSTIFTPSRVVEQWLQQRIAHRYGVCTVLNFASISAIWPPLLRALGSQAEALSEQVLSWRLAEMLRQPPWSQHSAILRLLGPAPGADALLALARRLAAQYMNYQLHRPGLCHSWLSEPAEHWQAHLWQAVVAAVQAENPQAASLALRWPDLAAGRVNLDVLASQLGHRLVLFGLSQLTPQYFAWLASARQLDVTLYLLTPGADVPWNVALDSSSSFVRQWGRVALSNQNVLESPQLWGRDIDVLPGGSTLQPGQGALAQLQYLFRSAGDARAAPVQGPDPSLAIHTVATTVQAAEQLVRQVRHLVEARHVPLDAIAVYCPALEQYASALQAAFGQGGTLRDWPIVIDDASDTSSGPAHALDRLLALVVGRIEPAAMRDLLQQADIAAWYGYDWGTMEAVLDQLVKQAPVRWGLDAAHKARWLGAECPASDIGSWSWALQRAVAGQILAPSADATTLGVLPLTLDADTLAALHPLQVLLRDLGQWWSQPGQTVVDWVQSLRTIWGSTLRPGYALGQTCELLASALLQYGVLYHGLLTLTEFVALCHETLVRLDSQSPRSHSGLHIRPWTASAVIPAQYTFLLGFDPESVPRRTPQSSMDLLYDAERMPLDPLWQNWGLFTPRDVDLSLLMQTVLASQSGLSVIARLINPVDAVSLNLPAPVEQMLQWLAGSGTPASAHATYVTQHGDWTIPLAPAGMRATIVPVPTVASALTETVETLDWKDFENFVTHPLRWFLRQRANLSEDTWQPQYTDDPELALSVLEQGSLSRAMLRQSLVRDSSGPSVDAGDVAQWGAAWLAHGNLREGHLGLGDIGQIGAGVRSLAQWALQGAPIALGPVRQIQTGGQTFRLVFDSTSQVQWFAQAGLPSQIRCPLANSAIGKRHDRIMPWALLQIVLGVSEPSCELHCRALDDELRVAAWPSQTGLAWLRLWLDFYCRSRTQIPTFLPLASLAAAEAMRAGETSTAALESARDALDPAAYSGSSDLYDARVALYVYAQGEDPLSAFDPELFLDTAVQLWTPWLQHMDSEGKS